MRQSLMLPVEKETHTDVNRNKHSSAYHEEQDSDIFVVKQLVMHRESKNKSNGLVEYLVEWEGDWPQEEKFTWEPEENIMDASLVGEYWRNLISTMRYS